MMKIAHEIADTFGRLCPLTTEEEAALEYVITERLKPIRDALHMMWDNPESMTASDIAAQYADAVEMLKETEHVAE